MKKLLPLRITGLVWEVGPLVFFLMLAIVTRSEGQASCNRIGWVSAVAPGCGAKIIDLDNAELLSAVAGFEGLIGGKTIRFSAEPAVLPAGCDSDGSTVVALTCVSDTLPCKAQFAHAVSPLNSYRLLFEADVYDPSTQFCFWKFGDGATATGPNVQHTFPHEGYFPVCLTVTDAYGCAANRCKTVFVSSQNPNWCDYDIQVTAVGTKLYGSIVPVNDNPGILKSIKWFDNKTNLVLGESEELVADLPSEGVYYICAQYEVASVDDGSLCVTTRCQALTIAAPGCANTALSNPLSLCPSYFVPVCACNGVTYNNECEAMAAGLTKWWAGECGVSGSGTCGADVDYEIVQGSPAQGYTVRFSNLASGNFHTVQFDFGDGSPIWQGSPGDTIPNHLYAKGGIFKTNLSVWKNNNCVSSATRLLVTDAINMSADKAPKTTDYIWPGDTNGDKKANVYDLLNLGLGFYKSGAPRPFATSAWAPQFAPNWIYQVPGSVNYKHLDCNGDGDINDSDRNAIEQHYSPIDTTVAWADKKAPDVWVKFDKDTLVVDTDNPAPLQIDANVMVADADKPVFGLYGLAFALRYPEYMNHNPDVYYSANSFFGFPNDILLLPKDHYDRRQLDMGFAQKSGTGVSGYGGIAKISMSTDIIIIIDVIEREESTVIPLVIPVVGVQAIDAEGTLMKMNGAVRDTLWLKLKSATIGVENKGTDAEVLLYPNPATDETFLLAPGLNIERIDAFNALGQPFATLAPTGRHSSRIDVQAWPRGWYTLQVQTDKGIAQKRILLP